MTNGRWRLELVEVRDNLPILWEPSEHLEGPAPPPGQLAILALMTALDLLAYRGSGGNPWRASYRHDPIAFLIDAMSGS